MVSANRNRTNSRAVHAIPRQPRDPRLPVRRAPLHAIDGPPSSSGSTCPSAFPRRIPHITISTLLALPRRLSLGGILHAPPPLYALSPFRSGKTLADSQNLQMIPRLLRFGGWATSGWLSGRGLFSDPSMQAHPMEGTYPPKSRLVC
jgi:hypothetical protein